MFANSTPSSAKSNIFGQSAIAQAPLTINPHGMILPQQNSFELQQQQQFMTLQQQQSMQWRLQSGIQQSLQPFQQQLFQQQQTLQQQQNLQQQTLQQQTLQQQQQDQQLQGQQQLANPQDQQYSNQAQYGQQFQPYFVPEPENYTNPNAIPERIDLQFYCINDKVNYIKAYLVLRFRNWQTIYHCNQTNRVIAESEAKVIAKNFLDFQQLEYDCLYQVTTEEGYWILKITDLDRVYLVLFDKNYRKDLACPLFEEYYKNITEQELLKVGDNIELFNQITLKLQQLTEVYEQKQLENKDNAIVFEYKRTDFQQNSYQVGLSQQCLITGVEKITLRNVTNQIHPAFQGSNLINDFKANFQPILSICICLLLVIIVVLLLYNFVIKGIYTVEIDIIEINQDSSQPKKKHLFTHTLNQ